MEAQLMTIKQGRLAMEREFSFNDPNDKASSPLNRRGSSQFDDVPIPSKQPLTFDELINRELRLQDEQKPSPSSAPKKRPFLRKGQGIARFEGPPAKPVRRKARSKPKGKTTSSITMTGSSSKRSLVETTITKGRAIQQKFTSPSVLSQRVFQSKKDKNIDDDNLDKMSESSFALTREQWHKQRELEEEELDEFRMLEDDIHSSVPATPTRLSLEDYRSGFSDDDFEHDNSEQPYEPPQQQRSGTSTPTPKSNGTKASSETAAFDDTASWGSSIEDGEATPKAAQPFGTRQPESPHISDNGNNSSSPNIFVESSSHRRPLPKTNLVEQLFSRASPTPRSSSPEFRNQEPEEPLGDLVVSKLAELDAEVLRFKTMNKELDISRQEYDKKLHRLKIDTEEFEVRKEEELNKINQYKEEEIGKIRREKRVWEMYRKAAKDTPDRSSRDEIERLRSQLEEVRQQLKDREQKNKIAVKRYKDIIQNLTQTNKELSQELQNLEEERVRRLSENPPLSDLHTTPKYTSGLDSPSSDIAAPSPRSDGTSISTPDSPTNNLPSTSLPMVPGTISTTYSNIINSIPASASLRDSSNNSTAAPSITRYPDGKVEKSYSDGRKVITFANGTVKEISADDHVVVKFFNGDIKQMYPNKQVVYFYKEAGTTHSTFPDGLEILEFDSGQTEKRYPNGTHEITFPDGTAKYIFTNNEEETIFPDGTIQRVTANGERVIEYANGNREVHTSSYKKRRYPDGTVKIVYPDGRQETKFGNGRVRVKDKDGTVIMDTAEPEH